MSPDPRPAPAVDVRPIRPEDHEVVGRVVLEAYDAVGPFDDRYRTFLADPDQWVPGSTTVYVAELEEEVVGAVAFVLPGDAEFEDLRPPAGDCGFRFLAVAPSAQGSGAGAALVDRVISDARRRGCHRMIIHSMAFMTGAHELYRRRGFVRRRDLDVRFPSGIGYAFSLDLTPEAPGRFAAPGPVPDEPPWYEEIWAREEDDPAVC